MEASVRCVTWLNLQPAAAAVSFTQYNDMSQHGHTSYWLVDSNPPAK